MKNSIDIAFKNANKENRPALISYTTQAPQSSYSAQTHLLAGGRHA